MDVESGHPYAFALQRALHYAKVSQPPTPRDLLSAVNQWLIPHSVLDALNELVAVWESDGSHAALACIDRLEAETGKAFEFNLARLSLLAYVGEDAQPATAVLERDVAHAYSGAKDLLRRGHSALARDILARVLPFAPVALTVKSDDAGRSMAALLSLFGLALQDHEATTDAVDTYRAALTLLDPRLREHRVEQATILTNIGALHQENGEYDKSSAALDEAVSICRGLLPDNATGLVAALTNRSQSEAYRGRRASAERDWNEANAVIRQYGLTAERETVEALLLQASHVLDACRWREGTDVLRLAWRGACRGGHRQLKAEVIAVAAQSALRAQLPAHPIKWFAEAISRLEALAPDHAERRIDAKRSLARAFNLAQQWEDALEVCQNALADSIESLGAQSIPTAQTHRELAKILWNHERFDEGEEHVRTAISILKAAWADDHPTLIACDGELAEHLMQRGADRDAVDVLCSCLEREDGALRRLIDARSDLPDMTDVRMASGQLRLLLQAASRAANMDIGRLRRVMDLRLRFGGSALAILKSGRNETATGRAVLSELMEPDAVVATSGIYDEDGETKRLLLLGSADATQLIDLGPTHDLDRDVSDWVDDPVTDPGPALQALIAELAKGIEGRGRLIWLPDHALAGYPVAPLPIDKARRIVDLVAVVQPRDAHCMIGPRRRSGGSALLVGVSMFDPAPNDEGLDALPGVREEIERVRRVYEPSCASLVDAEASLDAVVSGLGNAPNVLHIATHGLCGDPAPEPGSRGGTLRRQLDLSAEDDPLARCALLLAGKAREAPLLTARRLSILDLSSVSLAVLSACDTGVGLADAAEGVLGFQAALHHAGTATVVTSLWPIDDEIAPQLMEDFHRGLRNGERPSVALRRAQLRWSRTNSPHAWGGLTISGSDAPLVFAGGDNDE